MEKAPYKSKLVLIAVLYTIQGIPQGLSNFIPMILVLYKRPFSELGLFSVSYYPYTLKILWSPLVDAIFINKIGRRRSWVIPSQTAISFLLIYLGYTSNGTGNLIKMIADGAISKLTFFFFMMFFFATTQDIALDAWALKLLPVSARHLASACQTAGIYIGKVLGFNIAIALTSQKTIPPFLSYFLPVKIGTLLVFYGICILLTNIYVVFFVPEGENEAKNEESFNVKDSYKAIIKMFCHSKIKSLIGILLFSMVPFGANLWVEDLYLIGKGVADKEFFAILDLAAFPVTVLISTVFMRKEGQNYLKLWYQFFKLRLIVSIFLSVLVAKIAANSMSIWDGPKENMFLFSVMHIFFMALDKVQFIFYFSFCGIICDESLGGTYLTFLAILYNFSRLWVNSSVYSIFEKLEISLKNYWFDGYMAISLFSAISGIVWILMFNRKLLSLSTAKINEWMLNWDDDKKE